MITVSGRNNLETRFVETLLLLKGVEFAREITLTPTTLVDHTLTLTYPCTIMHYISEKYPYPELWPEDIERRAVIHLLVEQILHGTHDPEALKHHASSRAPFILGARPTMLDIVVAAATEDPDHLREIEAYANRAKRALL